MTMGGNSNYSHPYCTVAVLIDKTNEENLNAIERCIFVLCLDSGMPESMLSDSPGGASVSDRPQRGDVSLAEQMIHGHGSRVNSANRWFEKTMQVNNAQMSAINRLVSISNFTWINAFYASPSPIDEASSSLTMGHISWPWPMWPITQVTHDPCDPWPVWPMPNCLQFLCLINTLWRTHANLKWTINTLSSYLVTRLSRKQKIKFVTDYCFIQKKNYQSRADEIKSFVRLFAFYVLTRGSVGHEYWPMTHVTHPGLLTYLTHCQL